MQRNLFWFCVKTDRKLLFLNYNWVRMADDKNKSGFVRPET